MDIQEENNSNISEIRDVKMELLDDTASETSNNQQPQNANDIIESNSNNFSTAGIKRRNSDEPIVQERLSEDENVSADIIVKRPRYTESQCIEFVNNCLNSLKQMENIENEYTLTISTLPGQWTSQEIIEYLQSECQMNYSHINDNRNMNTETNIQIKLKFIDKEHLKTVYENLKSLEAASKLRVQSDDLDAQENTDIGESNLTQVDDIESNKDDNNSSADLDVASEDNCFYIRDDYLESLGIKKPITCWVTVTNFRCDKNELKEVLELAGKVLVCSVIVMNIKYANVMYSHPLEAIQAISMFHGQKLYGKTLKVTMNNSRDINLLLPKGLADVGPGLGKHGKGLPDVAYQFKNLINGRKSTIDPQLFQPQLLTKIGIPVEPRTFAPSIASSTPSNNNDEASEHSDAASDGNSEKNASVSSRNSNTHGNSPSNFQQNRMKYVPSNRSTRGIIEPVIVPRAPIETPRQIPPSPITFSRPITTERPRFQNSPNNLGPRPYGINNMMGQIRGPVATGPPNRFPGPNIGPVIHHPLPGPSGHNPNIPGNIGLNAPMVPPLRSFVTPSTTPHVQMFIGADPAVIQISNLPPSTNFAHLCQKLSEFGHVVLLQFTTPGCAVVRFAAPADADRCIQNFRNSIA